MGRHHRCMESTLRGSIYRLAVACLLLACPLVDASASPNMISASTQLSNQSGGCGGQEAAYLGCIANALDQAAARLQGGDTNERVVAGQLRAAAAKIRAKPTKAVAIAALASVRQAIAKTISASKVAGKSDTPGRDAVVSAVSRVSRLIQTKL